MAQKGFRPVRTLSGGHKFRSRKYPVNQNNAHDLFIGHAVILSSGNVVEHSSTGTTPLLGVIKATYTTDKNRPRTHNSGGLYIPGSAQAWVDVYDDPNIVFAVQVDATASAAMVGKIIDVVATGSGVPYTGQSGMVLDATTLTTEARTSGSSNAVGGPFKIVAAPSMLERDKTADNQYVDVIINFHAFKPLP